MNHKCYLCGSTENHIVFTEFSIPIFKCKNCTHVFSSYEQEEHYDGYWGNEGTREEYDLNWWDLAHREVYSHFIKEFMTLPEGKILDVGCGLGFFVKTVLKEKSGWEAIGYEMSLNAVKFAKEKNHLQSVHAGMVQESRIQPNTMDIITLWDVIEHIPKPHPLMNYLHSLLKPGGILFIQTPNFPIQLWKARLKVLKSGMKEGIHYLEARDHINDYTRNTLKKLALDTGFETPSYHVLPPIVAVSGNSSGYGKIAKILYYKITKAIWEISFKSIFLNNTLFAVMKKSA